MEKYLLNNPDQCDFNIGDSVFLKSDAEKKIEMTVTGFTVLGDQDCAEVCWLDANRQMQYDAIAVACLIKKVTK
jgi:hypothetical protein